MELSKLHQQPKPITAKTIKTKLKPRVKKVMPSGLRCMGPYNAPDNSKTDTRSRRITSHCHKIMQKTEIEYAMYTHFVAMF